MKYLKIKNLEDYSTRTLKKDYFSVLVVTWRYNDDLNIKRLWISHVFASTFKNSAKLFREIK